MMFWLKWTFIAFALGMPKRMSEDMPEDLSDRVPEDMPEHTAEDMPGRMP